MENNNPPNNLAHPLLRLLAFLIEILLAILFILILIFGITNQFSVHGILNMFMFAAIYLLLLYPISYPFVQSFFISRFGADIGKLVVGLRIVNKEGKNISFWRGFFRNHIGYIISGLFFQLGFIWMLVDKSRQAWHDMLAGTFVVVKNKVGALIGILIFLLLIAANTYLVMSITNNIQGNLNLYQEIYTDVVDYFKGFTSSIEKQENPQI
jgi:uncharacterized RDD family membrane protein YckC